MASGNPTLERLLRKLSLVDKEDIDTVMNKMNLILQLPVPVKGELKRSEAEARIKEIEDQLKTNSIGAAYIGTNEKITQLGREINSKLMDDIKYLTGELLNQLGLNERVFNGTASAAEMQNYYVRTVEPIAMHIQQEFQRKFITKTAYTQGQRITIYMDPLNLLTFRHWLVQVTRLFVMVSLRLTNSVARLDLDLIGLLKLTCYIILTLPIRINKVDMATPKAEPGVLLRVSK